MPPISMYRMYSHVSHASTSQNIAMFQYFWPRGRQVLQQPCPLRSSPESKGWWYKHWMTDGHWWTMKLKAPVHSVDSRPRPCGTAGAFILPMAKAAAATRAGSWRVALDQFDLVTLENLQNRCKKNMRTCSSQSLLMLFAFRFSFNVLVALQHSQNICGSWSCKRSKITQSLQCS